MLIPQGDDCCTDIQCKSGETEACSNRLMAAQVVVGNFRWAKLCRVGDRQLAGGLCSSSLQPPKAQQPRRAV